MCTFINYATNESNMYEHNDDIHSLFMKHIVNFILFLSAE